MDTILPVTTAASASPFRDELFRTWPIAEDVAASRRRGPPALAPEHEIYVGVDGIPRWMVGTD